MPKTDDEVAIEAGHAKLATYFHNQIHSEENIGLARAHYGGHPSEEQLAQYFWLHGDLQKRKDALSVIKKVVPKPWDANTPVMRPL